MTEQNNSLINLGNLAKPAEVLVEKISDAVGGIFKPHQIRRVAQAEAEAEKIKAIAKIEIAELTQRALSRFLIEETNRQNNIENITRRALVQVVEEAKPENIEKDWLVNFFDKAKLVSDEDMQDLWARILSGEANNPGKYTKRTINMLASIDKRDAEYFTKFCHFVCSDGGLIPLVFDYENPIYTKRGISFSVLKHLDSIGLISFDSFAGYKRKGFGKMVRIFYGGKILSLEFTKDADNELDIGKAIFTNSGIELSSVIDARDVEEMIQYMVDRWTKDGVKVTLA